MISASDALGVLLAALLLALPSVARGEPDEATKAAARQLAQDGARAMEEKRYADAQDLLNRAYELVPAPTIAVLEARALDALGRLVEAAEHYELARRTELGADASDAFVEYVRSSATKHVLARAHSDELKQSRQKLAKGSRR